MADAMSALSGVGNNLKVTLGAAGVYIMWIVIIITLFVIVGVALWFYYSKKSYNINIIILRPRAKSTSFNFETGKMGKQYFDKKKKEVRFKIYQAKKFGLQYNEEAIKQEYFIDRIVAGKHSRTVFFAPNDQGWLQPIKLDFDMNSKGLKATVDNADLSYYNTELELMDSLFNNKGFFEKYYLLILVILMIVVVCIQWYAAAQIHKSSINNLEAVKLLTQTAQNIASSAGQASQVIKVG